MDPKDEQPVGHWTQLLKETFRSRPDAPPEVLRRQIAAIYRHSPLGLTVHAAVALLLGWWQFRSGQGGYGAALGVAGILLVCALRYADGRIHRTLTLDPEELARARRNLRLGAACQGLGWGIASTLLLPPAPLQQVAALALVVWLVAGGLLTLAPIGSIYALYLVPALAPICFRLAGSGSGPALLAGAAGLACGFTLLLVAARASRWLEDTLLAARDHRTLLEHLRTANDALVDYHAHLEATVAERIQGLRTALAQLKDERRRDREREEAQARTRQLEDLGRLAGGIAHDFNNLLGAMLGSLDLLRLQTPEDAPGRLSLTRIDRAVRRAAALTRQLLAYSGKGQSVRRPIDLNQLLRDLEGLLEVCVSRQSALGLDLDPELPPVLGDPAQLQQAVVDLVTNASEALDGGAGEIRIATRAAVLDAGAAARASRIVPARPGPHVVLEVRDTGHGLAPELQSRIFEPFFTTKEHGRGLGLAAVLGILKGHEAGLELDSRPGAGAAFRLYLPVAQAAAGLGLAPAPAGPGGFHGRALVVDDEPVLLETAQAMLERLGLEVATAANGLQAMEYMASHGADLDLVLLDLAMPLMDGRQTFRAMRRLRPELPIILSSGNDPRRAPRDGSGREARYFLRKPYSLTELKGALAAALAGLPAA